MSAREHFLRPVGLVPREFTLDEKALLFKQANALVRAMTHLLQSYEYQFRTLTYWFRARTLEFAIGSPDEFYNFIAPAPIHDLREDLLGGLFYANQHPSYPLWFMASRKQPYSLNGRVLAYSAEKAKKQIAKWLQDLNGETGQTLYQLELLVD